MKFLATKLAAATALALAVSNVNAATIDDNSVIISLVADGAAGASMLIDTGVDLADFQSGAVSSWVSDADLTAAISGFIAGGSNVQWYVAGRTASGFDKWFGTTKVTPDVGAFDNGLLGYKTNANVSYYANNTVIGSNANWAAPVPAGDGSHYQNVNITALLDKHGLDEDVQFVTTQTGLFAGSVITDLEFWRLGSDGVLSYGAAVPVPAAVWLFGSGLLGLVGVARRRAA